mgnify:CR=1 FL=1
MISAPFVSHEKKGHFLFIYFFYLDFISKIKLFIFFSEIDNTGAVAMLLQFIELMKCMKQFFSYFQKKKHFSLSCSGKVLGQRSYHFISRSWVNWYRSLA